MLINPDGCGQVRLAFDDDVGGGAVEIVAEHEGAMEPIMRLAYDGKVMRVDVFALSSGRRGEMTAHFIIDLPEQE
jgi:hypothetical protein